MNKDEKVLKAIYDHFVKSSDYNGIALTNLSKKTKIDYLEILEILKNLVNQDKVSIQSGVNPFIIGIAHYQVESQLKILEDAKNNKSNTLSEFKSVKISFDSHLACAYPSQKTLQNKRRLTKFVFSPYDKDLALGEPQLKPIFFEMEVLERYAKDPRYSFEFEDYSGNIYHNYDENDKPLLQETDQVFLKTFGLGFDEFNNRIIVAYLRYLGDLTPEHQMFWKNKEIKNRKCKMLEEYFQNTIEGNWTNTYSLFSGFIGEQKLVNDYSKAIFNIELFRKTFEDDKKPKDFTVFILPTLENFNNFIHLLDKMTSENLNKKFFEGKIELYEDVKIDKQTFERKHKNTLRLLEEWLRKSYNFDDDEERVNRLLFSPLKSIRKERQNPAHKISNNTYDKKYIEMQRDFLSKAYNAMKNLRYILQSHPKSKVVEIPEWLDNGKFISY